MFEKEAEEYTERKYFQYGMNSKDYKQCFQDGAEFGYNKANEWHYVKDGDLPNMNTEVLFYCYGRVKQGLFVGFFKSYYGDHKVEEVLAWKEIVLPELPKESE